MSYEENIDVAAQRIKGFSFDVVSDIQSKISSLNLILNETQDLELKNQISATLNQLQNQMTLVLSNTMALTETILGYKELLGNHIFSDEAFLSSVGSGKEAKPVIEKPETPSVDAEVKPVIETPVEEKPETPSIDAEVKPVIEAPVEEKPEAPSVDAEVKLITDSIEGEKGKNGDSIEIMSIADGDSSTIADSDVSNDTTTISASPDQMSSSGSEEGVGSFRIGESLATESISTLDNNNPLGELTFLLKNSTPRAIVVTFEQFNKLQNSCQEQASKLVFDDVTEENLEEMMTNLPSLYEINPDEAEKLSAKITAKLQELENKE